MGRNKQKHEFAVYYTDCATIIADSAVDDIFTINDKQLCHRIHRVLRLLVNDPVIIFDRFVHATCVVQKIDAKKDTLVLKLKEKQENNILSPHITFFLPVLKRDDLESAVYFLTELGVNDIQFVVTEKVQQKWDKKRAHDRLQRIMIAAAEQSKSFAFPTLYDPISFDQLLTRTSDLRAAKIYFDQHGESLLSVLTKTDQARPEKIILMVGPEGDLVNDERIMLQRSGFTFCCLTPTILRANHAVGIGAGAFRSLFFKNTL